MRTVSMQAGSLGCRVSITFIRLFMEELCVGVMVLLQVGMDMRRRVSVRVLSERASVRVLSEKK
jgi:hypothetical protein